MITQKDCKFFLNGIEMPFIHVDDLHGIKLNEPVKPEVLRRVLLTAIRKADVKGALKWV